MPRACCCERAAVYFCARWFADALLTGLNANAFCSLGLGRQARFWRIGYGPRVES